MCERSSRGGGAAFRLAAFLAACFTSQEVPASPGSPWSQEIRVNTLANGDQATPVLVGNANNQQLYVWASGDPNNRGLRAQVVDNGAFLGSEFAVAPDGTVGANADADLAAVGAFVICWRDPNSGALVARLFDDTLQPRFESVRIEQATGDVMLYPSVAIAPDGSYFFLVWGMTEADGTDQIVGQRFSSDGMPLEPVFEVGPELDRRQSNPDVVIAADGTALVVWQSFDEDNLSNDVFAQRFASDRSKLGDVVRVNTTTLGDQISPRIGADAENNYIIGWWSTVGQIRLQRLDRQGRKVGPEIRADDDGLSGVRPNTLDVGADPRGRFGVVWSQRTNTGYDIYGRLFDGSGTPEDQILLNVAVNGDQVLPRLTLADEDNIVASWQGPSGSGSGSDQDVFTRYFEGFGSSGFVGDRVADEFSFSSVENVEPSSEIRSNAITVRGINQPASIAVTGGQYSVGCTDTWTTTTRRVETTDFVCVRHTSASTYSTRTETVLTIGEKTVGTFTSTTRSEVAASEPPDNDGGGGGGGGVLGVPMIALLALAGLWRRARTCPFIELNTAAFASLRR